jgi:hypothetical protein
MRFPGRQGQKSLDAVLLDVSKQVQTFGIPSRGDSEALNRALLAVVGIGLANCVSTVGSGGEHVGEVKVGGAWPV